MLILVLSLLLTSSSSSYSSLNVQCVCNVVLFECFRIVVDDDDDVDTPAEGVLTLHNAVWGIVSLFFFSVSLSFFLSFLLTYFLSLSLCVCVCVRICM